MDYVNKIKKNEVEAEIHDARIEDLSALATKDDLTPLATKEEVTVVKSTIDGTSLVIPEQPAPEPIINIDGVDYYHKHEFDLEALAASWSGTDYSIDILTGEAATKDFPAMSISSRGSSEFRYVSLRSYYSGSTLYTNNPAVEVTYTSHAFTIVDEQSEVTDGTKICLPDCYAYYGFLSEDGKTFISYFTLKTDIDGPSTIDSVKQGDTIIPIGGASGGVKLYTHYLNDSTNRVNIRVISTDSTPYTESGTDLFAKLERAMLCPSTSKSDIMAVRYRGSHTLAAITFEGTSVSFDSDNYVDNVSEL